jgi:hypothetical protein
MAFRQIEMPLLATALEKTLVISRVSRTGASAMGIARISIEGGGSRA